VKGPAIELRNVSKTFSSRNDRFFQKTSAKLIERTSADQRLTVSVLPTLSQQQFAHNLAFELKFSQDIKDVAYRQVIDPRWLSAS
jgi:NitT/TauT family transport system substrate-binding protein